MSPAWIHETRFPETLIGIWHRQSIARSGVPGQTEEAIEHSDVWWFQARTRYADLRIPRSGTGHGDPFVTPDAFGGRQSWLAPRLRFHHELDRHGRFATDQGDLAWDGDTLVETGTFEHGGTLCTYTERWVRASPRAAAVQVWELRDSGAPGPGRLRGLSVRIGDRELLLVDDGHEVAAAHRRVGAAGRALLAHLGTAADLLDPADADDRSGWRCIEGAP